MAREARSLSPEIRPDNVAIYIRWSTDDQAEGTTLEVQKEACELYLRSQGWIVQDDLVFIDEGHSGGNLRRPALTALRKAVKAGQVDCIVVFKLDRLSRSVVDTVNLVLEEWEGRCFFKSARDPIDTSTPAGKMLFYLLASYAEWERNIIRERTAGGRLQRAQQGRWAAGSPPFAFRVDGQKHLVLDEAEAAVVRGIFDSYLKGRTIGDVVRQLQREGAPAPGGPGKWSKPLVRRVLSNPVYMGMLQFGRWKTNPRHGRDPGAPRLLKAESPAVHLQGGAPAIVDAATFIMVQQLKSERDARKTKNSGRAYSSQWLLSGVAKCKKCGSSFAARAPREGRSAFYYCLGRAFNLTCDCRQVRVQDLDAWFVGELKRVYGDHIRRRELVDVLQGEQRQRVAELEATSKALEESTAQLEREQATVRRRFRADQITPQEYHELSGEITRELAENRRRINVAEQELTKLRSAVEIEGLVARFQAIDVFESLEHKDKKHLVFQVVKSLRVYRGPDSGDVSAVVEWRLPCQVPFQ